MRVVIFAAVLLFLSIARTIERTRQHVEEIRPANEMEAERASQMADQGGMATASIAQADRGFRRRPRRDAGSFGKHPEPDGGDPRSAGAGRGVSRHGRPIDRKRQRLPGQGRRAQQLDSFLNPILMNH